MLPSVRLNRCEIPRSSPNTRHRAVAVGGGIRVASPELAEDPALPGPMWTIRRWVAMVARECPEMALQSYLAGNEATLPAGRISGKLWPPNRRARGPARAREWPGIGLSAATPAVEAPLRGDQGVSLPMATVFEHRRDRPLPRGDRPGTATGRGGRAAARAVGGAQSRRRPRAALGDVFRPRGKRPGRCRRPPTAAGAVGYELYKKHVVR